VDRLHYYYTTTFLLVVAVLISLKMFGGSPIECWLPAEFRPSWQEYTGFSLANENWVNIEWIIAGIFGKLGQYSGIFTIENLEDFPGISWDLRSKIHSSDFINN
jgi:hypothetical protein